MAVGELVPERSSGEELLARGLLYLEAHASGGRRRCVEGEKLRVARLDPLQACRCSHVRLEKCWL
jgi:hypothetical protein